MLAVEGMSVNYGEILALTSVSASIGTNEVACLLGSNGSGKSTFMKALIGLVPLREGAITFDGAPIHSLPTEARVSMGIASVPEGRGMLPRMTVLENLLMGGYVRGSAKDLKDDVERVFGLFPQMKERSRQMAGTLSGGEQQMLAIARALMLRPKLVLMDEPSMGLAPVIVERVFSIIEDIKRMDTTVLLVEQNAHMALSVSHRFYVLQKGEIVLGGKVQNKELLMDDGSVLTQEELEEAYLGG